MVSIAQQIWDNTPNNGKGKVSYNSRVNAYFNTIKKKRKQERQNKKRSRKNKR